MFMKADTQQEQRKEDGQTKSHKPTCEVTKETKNATKSKLHPMTNVAITTRKATYNGFAIFSRRSKEALASFDSPNNYVFLPLSAVQLRLFERQTLKANGHAAIRKPYIQAT